VTDPDVLEAILDGLRCLARYRADGTLLATDRDAGRLLPLDGPPTLDLWPSLRLAHQAPPPQRSTHVLPAPVNLAAIDRPHSTAGA